MYRQGKSSVKVPCFLFTQTIMKSQHFGLFFTGQHVQQARKNRDRAPFQAAWALLDDQQPSGDLAAAQWGGLRCRFNDDSDAGAPTVVFLRQGILLEESAPYLEILATTLVHIQCFELVRDHPAWGKGERDRWLHGLLDRVSQLNQPQFEVSYVEQVSLGALNVAAGAALERDDILQAGVETYQQVVRDDLRPQGHLPKAVEDPALAGDGQGLFRQLMVVNALVLMAEAASHVGVDLWGYTYRGVSVMTGIAYLIYYYHYPEQWQWDAGMTQDAARGLFREHGGFLEMINHHEPPKSINTLLDDLRPIYDLYGGGLTTLTHGVARRGLFR
jgi:hypothetical protein